MRGRWLRKRDALAAVWRGRRDELRPPQRRDLGRQAAVGKGRCQCDGDLPGDRPAESAQLLASLETILIPPALLEEPPAPLARARNRGPHIAEKSSREELKRKIQQRKTVQYREAEPAAFLAPFNSSLSLISK